MVERDPDGVKAGLPDEFYIFVSDIVITISLPETPRLILPDELINHDLNQLCLQNH
jgi:hypothetical protein